MKAEFIVTIEGDWFRGDKRVTEAMMQADLREAVTEQFKHLAKRTSVKKHQPEAPKPHQEGA